MSIVNISENTAVLIARLANLRLSFSHADANHKIRLIHDLSTRNIMTSRKLIDYHETLCFIQAYPDNSSLKHLADSELQRFADRIENWREKHPDNTNLDDTGMAGTPIYYPYNLDMTRHLLNRFGLAIEIDWQDYKDKGSDPISGLLPLFALYMENDGIDDEDSSTENWVNMARGKDQNALKWLISQLDVLTVSPEARQYIFENAGLMLRWDLGRSEYSRTLAKLPHRRIYFQRGPIGKKRLDLKQSIRKSVPELSSIPADSAGEIIGILIRALLPRHRELFPATYASPEEVYITSPGRGLDIYFLGMKPESRMPLESNYAALLIKNGVPIGYGIAVLFFERCELAINVFDSFRSGEAAFIFEHFFRVLYHHFGGRDFIMRKWQVGYDNDEGIQSGSYWFYYKMGFRSLDPAVDALATSEWKKISRDKKYRTGPRTLKKLAESDMIISPGRENEALFNELSVIKLGYAVTKLTSERFDGDRQAAQSWATEYMGRILDIDLKNWTAAERLQFERFAPLLTLIKDISSWNRNDKDDLIATIRAKAATKEIEYVHRLQRHHRLESALRMIESSA